jgi:RNA polymerase sigma factor (sigma-70 family)
MELVHVELESIARRRLSRWPGLRTKVEPKELVSELFLRLRAYCPAEIWTNRAAFWAAVGTVLHRVLLDMSRPKTSSPPSRLKITIGDTADLPAARQEWDEVEFRLLLDRLEQVNRRQRQVLEFHLVMGIDQQEIADALGVSLSTVRRDLQLAQAWVRKRWLGVRVKE